MTTSEAINLIVRSSTPAPYQKPGGLKTGARHLYPALSTQAPMFCGCLPLWASGRGLANSSGPVRALSQDQVTAGRQGWSLGMDLAVPKPGQDL